MHAEKVESDRQVWLRFRAFADRADLIARAAESDVLLITHGGTIKAVICSELGIPPDRPFPFKIDPASAAALAVRDQHLQLCLLWQNDDRTATANFVESR
jgi:broad specificity phosphatase PhoE